MAENKLVKQVKKAANDALNKADQLGKKTGEVLKNAGNEIAKTTKNVGNEIVRTTDELSKKTKNVIHDVNYELDKKKYCPITLDEYKTNDIELPKLLRLLPTDTHQDSEACANAIGYMPKVAKTTVFELIKKNLNDTKIKLKPTNNGVIYVLNPYETKQYINVNDYFEYIKNQRISELVDIANKLGAKHVKISIKEEKKKFVVASRDKNEYADLEIEGIKADAKSKKKAELIAKNMTTLEIVSDDDFDGSDKPKIPKLAYYKNDPIVEQIINNRMNEENRQKRKSYMIKYSKSSDLNINDAKEIDAVIDKLGFGVGATATYKAEVEKEKRLYFEYIIEF